MIEIQYTSYQTSYQNHYQVIRPTTESTNRILPEDAPTFKCSRCGHVFRAELHQKPPRWWLGYRAPAPPPSARTRGNS
jgi:hypothetical protein